MNLWVTSAQSKYLATHCAYTFCEITRNWRGSPVVLLPKHESNVTPILPPPNWACRVFDPINIVISCPVLTETVHYVRNEAPRTNIHVLYKDKRSDIFVVVGLEYCHGDTFTAECPSGYVVLIEGALYGRMFQGDCVARDYGHIGCGLNVLGQLDAWCSGRAQCSFVVSTLHDLGACEQDLVSYLLANWTCLPGNIHYLYIIWYYLSKA